MLLGKVPKDFDISTNATPEQVHRLFRNSRIIGRRFKIVHVVFGQEIIEVTTFRSAVNGNLGRNQIQNDDGMLIRDNSYGKTLEEDATRRDFTINAIYYDISNFTLIDFHGGLYDLNHGIIDIIGDPHTRYQEDPVRMIRAVRFSAKLGFKISKRTADPIKTHSALLLNVSNARMFDEVNKLFLTGHGLQSFHKLRDFGLFNLLFPGLDGFIENKDYQAFVEYSLASSDQRFAQQKRNMPHFLYTIMFLGKFRSQMIKHYELNESRIHQVAENVIADEICQEILAEQNAVTALPWQVSADIRKLLKSQNELLNIHDPNAVAAMADSNILRASFDIFKLRGKFEPYLSPYIRFWQPYYDRSSQRAEQRRALLNKKEEQNFTNAKSKQKKNKPAEKNGGYKREKATSRAERLAKARAWRAAMHLDP